MIINSQYTPTQLRNNIYNILDEVISTGQPILINRDGEKLVISKMDNKRRDIFSIASALDIIEEGVTDDELIYHNSAEWDEEPEL